MGKILGIDLGTKRTGIAITDEMQIIASPLETVMSKVIVEYLEALVPKEDVELIVLGEPRHLDGNAMEMTGKVHKFRDLLKRKFPNVPVVLEDEMFTSKMAAEALRSSGAKKKKRRDKTMLDKISAALILQSYLERRNLQKPGV